MGQDGAAQPRVSGPRAITRVLDLLLLLADRRTGMTLAELSMNLAVPKSTFLSTLRGLCEQQYLIHEHGRYRLDAASYHLASRIVTNWSAPEVIRAEVRALTRSTGESAGFAIADWDHGQAIYTEAMNSTQPVRYAMQAGLRAPLYASAAGRVILAFASSWRLDTYLARTALRPLTSRTRVDPAAIRVNLAEIREQGYCASFGEMLSDTAALAVPVRGPEGRILGALMLAAPLERMRVNHAKLLDTLLAAGRRASAGRDDDATPAPSDDR